MAMKFNNAKHFAESVLNDNDLKTKGRKKADTLVDLDVDVMEFVLGTVGYVYKADNFKRPEIGQRFLASCYDPNKVLVEFCGRCIKKERDMCSYFSDVTDEEWLELFYAIFVLTSIRRAEEHIPFHVQFVTERSRMLMTFAALVPFEVIVLESMSKSDDDKIKSIAKYLAEIITSSKDTPFIPMDVNFKKDEHEEFLQVGSELVFDIMKLHGHLFDATVRLIETIKSKKEA